MTELFEVIEYEKIIAGNILLWSLAKKQFLLGKANIERKILLQESHINLIKDKSP